MKKFNVKVNGTTYEVEVEEIGSSAPAAPAPAAAPAASPAPAGGTSVKAPMQGTINKINCSAGDTVKKGDVLIILEAMKMENEIMAPSDGKVANVSVKEGDTVGADDILITLS